MSRLLRSALFSLLTLLIIFGLAEVALRALGVRARVDNPFFMLVRVFEYPEYFQKDARLLWRLRANIGDGVEFIVRGDYRTNSLGLRGGEVVMTPTRQMRVACFGNSCVFGWRLNEDETFPAQLRDRLRVEDATAEVVNCGVPGYSTFQGLRFVEELLAKIKPHFATICYGWNDHWAAGFDIPDKEQRMPPAPVVSLQNLLARSQVYRAIKYALLSRSEKSREFTYNRTAPVYRVSLEDYRQNLKLIIARCQEQGVMPILITAPIGDADPDIINAVEDYHGRYVAATRETAVESGTPLVDAALAFTGRSEFFDDPRADFIHYNAAGARALATLVAATIDSMRQIR